MSHKFHTIFAFPNFCAFQTKSVIEWLSMPNLSEAQVTGFEGGFSFRAGAILTRQVQNSLDPTG